MPSSNRWHDVGMIGNETLFNVSLGLTASGVSDLTDLVITPPLSHIIFGDYSKWCSNLQFLPYDITKDGSAGTLSIGGSSTDIPVYDINIYHTLGYTLGQYHYEPLYNDFRDFEPYTILQIYLPFFGFADIKVADVINKYIQFRLNVDFPTGQAMYTIGVSDTSLDAPNAPYSYSIDDTNTRIIGTYVFQIGYSIPLGTVGMSDTIRNITMSAIKGAATIGASYLIEGAGVSGTSATTKEVKTRRNPKTGRQITQSTRTKTTEYDGTNYQSARRINAAFDTAVDALNNMHLNPSIDKPNNTVLSMYGSKSVKIVRKLAKVKNVDENYGKLYGYPLGETRVLNTIHGYTEISNIHLEGEKLGLATQKELLMLEQILDDGVILP